MVAQIAAVWRINITRPGETDNRFTGGSGYWTETLRDEGFTPGPRFYRWIIPLTIGLFIELVINLGSGLVHVVYGGLLVAILSFLLAGLGMVTTILMLIKRRRLTRISLLLGSIMFMTAIARLTFYYLEYPAPMPAIKAISTALMCLYSVSVAAEVVVVLILAVLQFKFVKIEFNAHEDSYFNFPEDCNGARPCLESNPCRLHQLQNTQDDLLSEQVTPQCEDEVLETKRPKKSRWRGHEKGKKSKGRRSDNLSQHVSNRSRSTLRPTAKTISNTTQLSGSAKHVKNPRSGSVKQTKNASSKKRHTKSHISTVVSKTQQAKSSESNGGLHGKSSNPHKSTGKKKKSLR